MDHLRSSTQYSKLLSYVDKCGYFGNGEWSNWFVGATNYYYDNVEVATSDIDAMFESLMVSKPDFRMAFPYTNNPLESFNSSIKRVAPLILNINSFLESSIPSILHLSSLDYSEKLSITNFYTCDQATLVHTYKIESTVLELAINL